MEPTNKIKVLIADDDPSVLLTLEKLVQKTFPDLLVYTATNGQESWDIIEAKHPNIVLSDISMPLMDGIQVLIKVRADEKYNDLLYIIITGNNDALERLKALDRGADELISKPIISDRLEARMKSALRIVRLQLKMKEENQLLMDLADMLERDVQDMARLAVKFMQARVPNSYDQLQRISASSVWIAQQLNKFTKDEIRDIEIAAYLCLAGRMSLPDSLIKQPVMMNGKVTHELMYQVPVAAKEIVSSIARFADVGKILYHIYENIDGSGFPARLQAWQIPMASRVIRVALDFEELRMQTGKNSLDVIQLLHIEAKRLYDHRVVILLEHYVRTFYKDEVQSNDIPLLLADLKEGMIVARDIISESGLKLLPAGITLRENIIAKILAHNSSDPIIGNVYVKKKQ